MIQKLLKYSQSKSIKKNQKAAKAAGYLIGNKITHKITRPASQSTPGTFSKTNEKSIEIPKEQEKNLQKKRQTIDELRLI